MSGLVIFGITIIFPVAVLGLMIFALLGKPWSIWLGILAGVTLIIVVLTPFAFMLSWIGQNPHNPWPPELSLVPLAVVAILWLGVMGRPDA
jgi:hypothetical protein